MLAAFQITVVSESLLLLASRRFYSIAVFNQAPGHCLDSLW